MFEIRKSTERGPTNIGWLDSKHTFSFGQYHDPKYMGFESLRVLNDDRVAPGQGFGMHPHDNMEIISYVLSGELAHKDSMGNGSVIRPGDVQRLSAGTGMMHSEFNHSDSEEVHFLQIWFLPGVLNVEPSYEQKSFSEAEKRGAFRLVASKDGRDGSVLLHQDMDMSIALVDGDETADYTLAEGRSAWAHVARGEVTLNDHALSAGDGVAIRDISDLHFTQGKEAEVILFDMKALH